MKAIILGSDRGVRHLDSAQSYPLALVADGSGGRVLDWILSALAKADLDDVAFVGGYHIEKMIHLYPGMRFYYNPDWQEANDLQALAHASSELDDSCVILRSDIVFRPDVVRSLLDVDADVVIGTHKCIPPSIDVLSNGFAGLVALSTSASLKLREEVETWSREAVSETAPELIQVLVELGLSKLFFDVGNDWARIETPQSLSHFVFGTKAQTLERLQPLTTQATILDQTRFSAAEWDENAQGVMDRVVSAMPTGQLVVRSSASSEDTWTESNAGKFHSELGVEANDPIALRNAIDAVVASFVSCNGSDGPQDEVFVQPYLDDVVMSGVLFTRHPETSAPYVVINYDDTSHLTNTVTSGQGKELSTAIVYKYVTLSSQDNPYLAHLMNVVSELEELLGYDALDVEFAFDSLRRCFLLQVRVLTGSSSSFDLTDADVDSELKVLRNCVAEVMQPRSHLAGSTTILANMPDWNPAELVGFSPRPLALSLFQYLITNRVWGQAREASGYRDTNPEPLVVALAGHPYVDTRASLNSFLPASLSPVLGEKLVEHSLTWLQDHPELHDKFEFEVALTCLDFDFERRRQQLMANGFTAKEVEQIAWALRSLTDHIVCGRVATIETQMDLVDRLATRREQALQTKEDTLISIVRGIDFLLDDCIRYGTLPFAIVARYAFIAMSFLKSMRARGVFSSQEFDSLLHSMPTVASEITADLRLLSIGRLSLMAFVERYGHLRPGTYDITSPSYAEAPEYYLGNLEQAEKASPKEHSLETVAAIIEKHSEEINKLIQEAGFSFSLTQLWEFIVASIPAREQAKFEYTKNLSAALSLIAELGEHLGLSRDDMSFLPLYRLLDLSANSPSNDLKTELARAVTHRRKRFSLHKAIKLPHMIVSTADIDCFRLMKWQPNFVTSERVVGPVVNIDEREVETELTDRIALIESADPGYDWVFGYQICGLVTKYGGVASHMAIRAAELGLPAAIGCGEVIYDQVLAAELIELDCAGRLLRVLR